MSPICDYAGYDYKKAFWDNQGREYEDECERQTLVRLLHQIDRPIGTLLDIGCGFGRLFDTYQPFANAFVLLDYAQHLLDQAKRDIVTQKPIRFVQGNMTAMPLDTSSVDVAITVRTLHHLENVETLFAEVYRVLSADGVFIFEIPNQRHLLNITRFFLGKLSQNPFSKTPIRVNQSFLNYHPGFILDLLSGHGFEVKTSVNTSFFRSAWIKSRIKACYLCGLDHIFQRLFSWANLTPSVVVMAIKKG